MLVDKYRNEKIGQLNNYYSIKSGIDCRQNFIVDAIVAIPIVIGFFRLQQILEWLQ